MEITSGTLADDRGSPWSLGGSGEGFLALVLGGSLSLFYAIVLGVSNGSTAAVLSLPLLAVFLLIQSNYRIALALLIISIFMNFHVWRYSTAVLFAVPLGLSFLWNYRDIEWKWFKNRLNIPLLAYAVCALPSLLNASNPVLSSVLLFNVAAFLVVFYVLIATLRTPEDLKRVAGLYLLTAVVNSLVVFLEFWSTGRRSFGFSWIFFVDYAGLGICVSAAMALVSKGKSRFIMLVVSTVLVIALVLTQTRGIWLATLVALAFVGVHALRHPAIMGETRKRIFKTLAIGAVVILGVATVVVVANPYIEKRATELGGGAEQFTEYGSVPNSIISRLLIWDTALNAFLANPIIGVGVYGFASSSHEYADVPSQYYRKYVRDLSPHQTFLAVLAETGIIGAIGFGVFFFSLLQTAFRSINRALDDRGRRYAFVCAMAVIYCAVSMFITDAWLWGQQIVLLGIVAGSMIANGKISGPTGETGTSA